MALAAVGRFSSGTPAPPRDPVAPPPPGFRLVEHREADTYTLLRYRAPRPVVVSRETADRLAFTAESAHGRDAAPGLSRDVPPCSPS